MRKNIYICKKCNANFLAQHKPEVVAPFMSMCRCGEFATSTFYKLEFIHKESKADKEFFYKVPGDINSLSERWL